jgi:dTDP-4-dehydrorhamnose reductase
MSKIMILGSQGMAGHLIADYLLIQNHEITRVARKLPCNINLDIETEKDLKFLQKYLLEESFDAVINCIGLLIKDSNSRPDRAIFVNSYFPHYLEQILSNTKTKLIHMSTDCVFSGKRGRYTENDIKDGEDWYAKSKAFGEVINAKDLTIRTSIIGVDNRPNGTGLLQWVLQQKNEINGYTKAMWNGITTLEMAKFMNYVITEKFELNYLYQLPSPRPISKNELLKLICKVWKKDLKVNENDTVINDKTVINTRSNEINYTVPDYETQLQELHDYIN